jgi:DNA-binding transcriptional ArsR family regulator
VAVTVVLQGAAVDRCTVRVSPLAELCACLHAFNEHSHHPDSRAWAGAVRAEITPALLAECQTWAPLWGSRRAQFMFPSDASGECGLDEEMSAIERLPTAVFVAMSALPIVDSDWSIAFHRLLEDRADRRTFTEHARRLSPGRLELAELLLGDPEEFRRQLLTFLRRFRRRVFEPEWRRVLPMLREEADRRRRELRRDGLAVIARVTATATEAHHPHRVVFDKLYPAKARLVDDPCVLLPSAHAGPHVTIKHARGFPIAIQYAVKPTQETPFDAVDRRVRALSDPSRVRICRAILRGRHTTVDLAHYIGMAEPQVSRHLRRLREAGLVRASREGRMVFYELDAEALKRIGLDFYDALWR